MNFILSLASLVALLGSILFLLVLLGDAALLAVRGRWNRVLRVGQWAGLYIGCYAVVLVGAAWLMPRVILGPGENRCFDDWCVAGISTVPATGAQATACALPSGNQLWIATVQVSSMAKRIHQRAADAAAVLEDQNGRQYPPCAPPLGASGETPRTLNDQLGPGESFDVMLAFALPADAHPEGVVVNHGAFPGILIIGDDQSLLHPHTLLRVAVK